MSLIFITKKNELRRLLFSKNYFSFFLLRYHTPLFHATPSLLVQFFIFSLWLICLASIHSFYFPFKSFDSETVNDFTFEEPFDTTKIFPKCLPHQTTHELIGHRCWFISLIGSAALFIPILLNWSNSPFYADL
jgi:hypothetical protein